MSKRTIRTSYGNRAVPVPEFRYSQIRQNLIEITQAQAQAETTQTTSFFFNLGADAPIMVCPSSGSGTRRRLS